ncbi:MAG: hypothetical protein O9340_11975 [Cyclobacteriaceae bacterium]|jgi:hypothetical protein|nr:hypothetical protein [Cyclobacteriaceae bacterium]
MPSTTETGTAKKVANFEDLISFCTSYGATYNPSKQSLKLGALNTLRASAQAALQAVKTAKTNHDNATNAREIAFKQLKPLATKVFYALSISDATEQTIADAKTINNKIHGRRAKKIQPTEATTPEENPTMKKTISVSQQSFDSQVDFFSQLVTTVSAEPSYAPNESELTIAGLNTYLTDLRAKNTAAINAATALSNARIARDQILNNETTGLIAIAKEVKLYIKSLYGNKSPQDMQVRSLKFF